MSINISQGFADLPISIMLFASYYISINFSTRKNFEKCVFLLSFCHCIVNPCICLKFMRRVPIVLKPGGKR